MNGIADHLTNKMMMMMIGLCKYSSKSRWIERDCLPDVLDTHRADEKKFSITLAILRSNAFIILVKGVVYDVFVTNHSVQASLFIVLRTREIYTGTYPIYDPSEMHSDGDASHVAQDPSISVIFYHYISLRFSNFSFLRERETATNRRCFTFHSNQIDYWNFPPFVQWGWNASYFKIVRHVFLPSPTFLR